MSASLEHARDLAAFVTESPTSFHAAAEGSQRLVAGGFSVVDERAGFVASPGSYVLVRDGALLAWRIPAGAIPGTPYRIVGAHTDSPGFVLKPRPDTGSTGWQQLGVEIYGGPLLNSWLDRELGLAGRVILTSGEQRLVRTGAIMRIPQLAIHLDRAVNEDGVKLDRQLHTAPVWSVNRPDLLIMEQIALLAGCEVADIDGSDLCAYATTPPEVFGPTDEFLASGRLDNLSSVHAALTALLATPDSDLITLVAAFDHEEIGSASRSGAAGPVLADVLSRISGSLGATPDEHHRALADSVCVSADTGHAVHPNYVHRHDPANRPLLNGGPLLKINANQRYATDGVGAALWRRACRDAGVSTQEFVSNNAVPCGSTIGPLTATRLGIRTVDVGIPLLSMHSARELAGVADPLALSRAIGSFFVQD
ncbi:MAG TPA: M18 family aminopeptidase [Microlunatus sp.]